MKRSAIIVAVMVWAMWFGQGSAAAEVLQLRAQLQAGGAGGKGVAGAQMDNSFHAGASGVSYGAAVGVELLFVDAWVEHNQYHGSNGLLGTWTQFMAGVDLNIDLGDKNRGAELDEGGKSKGGYSSMYAEVGLAVGFGVGTGQQVEPPLDNSELTDKGFLVQAHLGLGYRLNKLLSLGVIVPVQSGYMFKSGDGAVANDQGTQYQSVQAAAMLNLRMDLTLK